MLKGRGSSKREAVGSILVYLRDGEVGRREDAVEKAIEWRQRMDQEGKE